MRSQLAALSRQLDHAEARLGRLVESVSADRWNARNDPAAWSPGECIAHLNLTSAAYIPLLTGAIAEARNLPPKSSGKYRRDPKGYMLASMIGPLPTVGRARLFRVKTTAAFVPTGDEPQVVLVAAFKRYQAELKQLLQQGDGLQIDKVSVLSPFGSLTYSCYSAFTIIPRHQERHLQQAERVWADL